MSKALEQFSAFVGKMDTKIDVISSWLHQQQMQLSPSFYSQDCACLWILFIRLREIIKPLPSDDSRWGFLLNRLQAKIPQRESMHTPTTMCKIGAKVSGQLGGPSLTCNLVVTDGSAQTMDPWLLFSKHVTMQACCPISAITWNLTWNLFHDLKITDHMTLWWNIAEATIKLYSLTQSL